MYNMRLSSTKRGGTGHRPDLIFLFLYYHDVLATSFRSLRTKSRWALLPRINSLFSPLSRFICLRFSCLRDSLTNRFFFVLVASAGPVFVVGAAVSNVTESRAARVSVTHRSCTHHWRHQWPSSSSSPWTRIPPGKGGGSRKASHDPRFNKCFNSPKKDTVTVSQVKSSQIRPCRAKRCRVGA